MPGTSIITSTMTLSIPPPQFREDMWVGWNAKLKKKRQQMTTGLKYYNDYGQTTDLITDINAPKERLNNIWRTAMINEQESEEITTIKYPIVGVPPGGVVMGQTYHFTGHAWRTRADVKKEQGSGVVGANVQIDWIIECTEYGAFVDVGIPGPGGPPGTGGDHWEWLLQGNSNAPLTVASLLPTYVLIYYNQLLAMPAGLTLNINGIPAHDFYLNTDNEIISSFASHVVFGGQSYYYAPGAGDAQDDPNRTNTPILYSSYREHTVAWYDPSTFPQ